jgi:Fe-S oxidoreductase
MLYFRGCVAKEKLTSISDAVETILQETGTEYKINDDEQCCGSVLLRTGFFDDAKNQMQNNIDYLKDEEILVSCAGCYKTLKKDYSEILGLNLNVIKLILW